VTRLQRWSLAVIACLAAGAYLHAQPPAYEIRGTVTEPRFGGVPGVTVMIAPIGGNEIVATTDSQGAFRVTLPQPVTASVLIQKDGYFPPNSAGGLTFATPTAANPVAQVSLNLARGGEIGGQVLDEKTRQPLAGIEIFLLQRTWTYGRPVLAARSTPASVKTDDEGRFLFSESVPPGDYLVTARPPAASAFTAIPNFERTDILFADQRFEPVFWPGGSDAVSARAVRVASRGYGEIGTMLVRKTTQYRVHASFTGACTEDDTLRVTVLKRDAGRTAPVAGPFECDQQILMQGFVPGSYALYAVSNHQTDREDLENSVYGVAIFEVTDHNVDLTIPLQRMTVIQGQLTLPPGAAPHVRVPAIVTRPSELLRGAEPDAETTLFWTSDRTFLLAVAPGLHRLSITPFNTHSLREVRYNGDPLTSQTVNVNATGTHQLEIVVDDKFGTIAGTALANGRPAGGAAILLIPEGLRVEDLPSRSQRETVASDSGGFTAGSLPPGTYRVVAVTQEQRSKLDEPGALVRALAQAPHVKAGPGAIGNVEVRVLDLR
jgi:hypothetical protein